MKTETIPNQYDGPKLPAKRLASGHFSLDYANSDDAAEIDAGVRDTIKGIRFSIDFRGLHKLGRGYAGARDYPDITFC